MSRRPVLASLLVLTLLLVLAPADLGVGCTVCGKLGTCCCKLRPAVAAGSHCAAHACPMKAPAPDPEKSPTSQLRTDRFVLLPAPWPAPVPDFAGRVAENALPVPHSDRFPPPTPPPLLLPLV